MGKGSVLVGWLDYRGVKRFATMISAVRDERARNGKTVSCSRVRMGMKDELNGGWQES